MATPIPATTTAPPPEAETQYSFWEQEPLLGLRRLLWILTGGLIFCLVFLSVGVVFTLTLVGWPIAYEFFKFARFILLPVGYTAVRRSGRLPFSLHKEAEHHQLIILLLL